MCQSLRAIKNNPMMKLYEEELSDKFERELYTETFANGRVTRLINKNLLEFRNRMINRALLSKEESDFLVGAIERINKELERIRTEVGEIMFAPPQQHCSYICHIVPQFDFANNDCFGSQIPAKIWKFLLVSIRNGLSSIYECSCLSFTINWRVLSEHNSEERKKLFEKEFDESEILSSDAYNHTVDTENSFYYAWEIIKNLPIVCSGFATELLQQGFSIYDLMNISGLEYYIELEFTRCYIIPPGNEILESGLRSQLPHTISLREIKEQIQRNNLQDSDEIYD